MSLTFGIFLHLINEKEIMETIARSEVENSFKKDSFSCLKKVLHCFK
jgi:hypothetical protein